MSEQQFVRDNFFDKFRKTMGQMPFLKDAAAMYFCMIDPATPLWVKAQIAGALAYFIMPLDAIPDFLILVGYTDDAGVIAATLAIVALHITPEHRRKAEELFS